VIDQSRVHPVQLRRLLEYLLEELRQAKAERRELEEAWKEYSLAYRARPEKKVKTFPFSGASNLVIPVIATDVETMFARLMGIFFAPANLWSVKAWQPEMADVAPRIQEFLQWAQENELNLEGPFGDFMLEMVKLGTGVLKQRYTRDQRKVYEWRELDNGQVYEAFQTLLLKDQPTVHHVPLWKFWVPDQLRSINSAPWCGELIDLSWSQYMQRVAMGVYQGVDRIGPWYATYRGSDYEQQAQRLDRFSPAFGKKLELYEFWLDFDIDGDMQTEALVCTLHPDSQSYVRLDFNPFFNQDKPYSAARFMRQEGRFYGIGFCEMLHQFQIEVSTMHNQRIDNNTILNTVQYKTTAESGIKVDEPVYPGKIWKLQNIDDLQPFNAGIKADTTIPAEQAAMEYAGRRTGISDWVLGQSSPATGYSTAYTTQQMLQQAGRRTDQVVREIRLAAAETGMRVLELYQQFNPRGKEFALGQADGQIVGQVLRFPIDLIRRGLKVSVTATDAASSKEAKIRTDTIIMQQLLQFYQQYMTGLSYVVSPVVPLPLKQAAMAMIEGASTLMRRILDNYDVQDAERLIPHLNQAVQNGQQQLAQLAALQGANGGGASPVAAAGGPTGMAGVPGDASGNGAGAPSGMPQLTGIA